MTRPISLQTRLRLTGAGNDEKAQPVRRALLDELAMHGLGEAGVRELAAYFLRAPWQAPEVARCVLLTSGRRPEIDPYREALELIRDTTNPVLIRLSALGIQQIVSGVTYRPALDKHRWLADDRSLRETRTEEAPKPSTSPLGPLTVLIGEHATVSPHVRGMSAEPTGAPSTPASPGRRPKPRTDGPMPRVVNEMNLRDVIERNDVAGAIARSSQGTTSDADVETLDSLREAMISTWQFGAAAEKNGASLSENAKAVYKTFHLAVAQAMMGRTNGLGSASRAMTRALDQSLGKQRCGKKSIA